MELFLTALLPACLTTSFFLVKEKFFYNGCMSWKVKFFQTARGDYPVKKFAEEQEVTIRAKIVSSVDLLTNYGPYLKPPYNKKLRDKLYELRISGKLAVRIFYTIAHNEYYLLHAFKKKSQKTPIKELQTALDRMKEII